jgi:hypothetical protein
MSRLESPLTFPRQNSSGVRTVMVMPEVASNRPSETVSEARNSPAC